MAAEVDIGELITSSPDLRGGRARVTGTGITVMRIAGWHKLGFSPEEIALKTGLSLAEVHAALAYYHVNRSAIDADLDDEAAEYDRLSQRPIRKNEEERYRRRNGGDTWHFCSNCSSWPTSDYETPSYAPATGEMCNECSTKRANGNCS